VKTLELKNASKPLLEYATRLDDGGIVLTSKKKPIAVLVSVRGADAETLALSMNARFMNFIRRARAEVARGKVVSLERVKQEIADEVAASNKPLHRVRRRAARGSTST
jgi:hypothetical protein